MEGEITKMDLIQYVHRICFSNNLRVISVYLQVNSGFLRNELKDEIDIMEHLNCDNVIHHTVHTRYTNVLKNTSNPRRETGNVQADVTQWNITDWNGIPK